MSLVFDTSLYMNGGAGGGVSLDKIIVKSGTIPAAAAKYVGAVYQYVGETNSTYTHGYIYECKENVSYDGLIGFEPAKIAFDYTQGNLIEFLRSLTPDFSQVVEGSFTYDIAGDIWSINGVDGEGNTIFSNYRLYTQDLRDAGFVFINPSEDYADGEVIGYYLTLTPTSSYVWERIDVQPGATRGRFLALWNCATGLAESNPPTSPYPYGAGDYFIVGTVGTTNYKPSGSSYVIGTASTTVETNDVAVNDTYYYDGTNWNLQKNTATTYTSGTGISISNGAISVADPTLTNTATGSNSLTIDGTSSTTASSVNIGSGSSSKQQAVAVGAYALANGYASVALGNNVNINQTLGYMSIGIGPSVNIGGASNIGIGHNIWTSGTYSMQFGSGTNNEANTVKFGNGTDNWKLLDLSTGLIPDARLSTNVQTTSNLVTSVSSSSTDTQYPSAKLFYDTCGDIETLINAL